MALRALLIVATAGVAAYAAAQRLMHTDADIERLPEAARPPLQATRARLLSARARFGEALREGTAERDAAERELTREFHRRAGRS